MSDLTNNASWNAHESKSASASSNEYKVYFGLILLAALPICTLLWAYALVRNLALPEQGPIRKCVERSAINHTSDFLGLTVSLPRKGQRISGRRRASVHPVAGAARRQYIFSGEKHG